MPPPSPSEIFARAAEEGQRRLEQSMLELVATSFIAGFTIVFGIAALGIAHAATTQPLGEAAHLAGALAFGVGLVLPVLGRVELFNENFFDPIAATVEREGTTRRPLVRLWTVTFVVNLIGGALLVTTLSIPGALPSAAGASLAETARELTAKGLLGSFASAIAGGALVALLSHMLAAVETSASRIAVSYMVGFLLALGPFDHVIVTVLHLLFGVRFGALGWAPVAEMLAVVTVGNLVGGLGLVTVSHIAQAKGAGQGGPG